VASLSDKGRMGVVLPHGILFRGGKEAEIRKGLVEADLIEGVIGLASNLFYGASIPACILLINKKKPKAREGKIVFVNGAEHFREGKAQNYLEPEHVEKLAAAFKGFAEIEKLAKVVTKAEIAKNDYNLNISRYVHLSEAEEELDVAVELAQLKELIVKRNAAEATMLQHLKGLGYDS
jgi:type I restriction enzyme M protein